MGSYKRPRYIQFRDIHDRDISGLHCIGIYSPTGVRRPNEFIQTVVVLYIGHIWQQFVQHRHPLQAQVDGGDAGDEDVDAVEPSVGVMNALKMQVLKHSPDFALLRISCKSAPVFLSERLRAVAYSIALAARPSRPARPASCQ